MQRGISPDEYEIIVVDNGSSRQADLAQCERWMPQCVVLSIEPQRASVSPARALNLGIARARGDVVGVMIDGARMLSPRVLASALAASRLHDRAIILTPGFHLGAKTQMVSVLEGYDQAAEDRLLNGVRWHEDGYRLFEVSVFAGSCVGGWFKPMSESNALFMRRPLWDELGGYDERFESPGGGYVNLDTFERAVALPGREVVTLLGEGTFHQVHGGVATNSQHHLGAAFEDEYRTIRSRQYHPPEYESTYYGVIPDAALRSIAASARSAATPRSRRRRTS